MIRPLLLILLLLPGCCVSTSPERALMQMRDDYTASLTRLVAEKPTTQEYNRVDAGRAEASQALGDMDGALKRYRQGMAVMEAR